MKKTKRWMALFLAAMMIVSQGIVYAEELTDGYEVIEDSDVEEGQVEELILEEIEMGDKAVEESLVNLKWEDDKLINLGEDEVKEENSQYEPPSSDLTSVSAGSNIKISDDILCRKTINGITIEEEMKKYKNINQRQSFWKELMTLDWSSHQCQQVVSEEEKEVTEFYWGSTYHLIITTDLTGNVLHINITYSDGFPYNSQITCFGNCVRRAFNCKPNGGYGSSSNYTKFKDVFVEMRNNRAYYYDIFGKDISSQIDSEQDVKWGASNTITTSLVSPSITGIYNSVKGADLRWSKVSGASGYYIYRNRAADGLKKIATITNPNTIQYYDTGIQYGCWGRVFVYYIVAYDNNGAKSDKSNEVTLQRLAPMDFTGYRLPSTNSIELKWECTEKDNKALGYEIQYARSTSDLYNQKGSFQKVTVNGRNNLTRVITGLSSGTQYWFRIRGYVNYTNSSTGKTTKTWSQYSVVKGVRSAQASTPTVTPTPTPRPTVTPTVTPTPANTSRDISTVFNLNVVDAAKKLGLKRASSSGSMVYFTSNGIYTYGKTNLSSSSVTLYENKFWNAEIYDSSLTIYGVTVGSSLTNAKKILTSKGWTNMYSTSSESYFAKGPAMIFVDTSNGKITGLRYSYYTEEE